MYNVLLIENNDNLRNGIKDALRAKGIENIVEDVKGAKAFSFLKKQSFDLIILDIDLPGVNGFLICNRIKKDSKFSQIPLVVISEKSTEEKFKKHKGTPTAANMYIHLPLEHDDLVKKVFFLLEDPLDNSNDDDLFGDLDLDDSNDDILGDLDLDDSNDDILGDLELNDNDDNMLGDLDLDDGNNDVLGDLNLENDDNDVLGDLDLNDSNDDVLGDLDLNDDIDIDVLEDNTKELNTLENKIGDLKKELDDKNIEIKELNKKIIDYKTSLESKEDTVDISSFEERIMKLELENKNKDHKIIDLNKMLEDITNNSNSTGSSNREVLKLKQELTQKGRDIIEYKELYNSKEREVLDLKDSCNTLELKIADQDDLISGYRRKISLTENELSNLKNDFTTLTETTNTLKDEKSNLENELSDDKIKIISLSEKLENYEKEISELKSSLEEKNKEINHVLLPSKQSLEVEVDRYKNDYMELNNKFKNLVEKDKENQDKIILLEQRTSDNFSKFKEIELQKSKIKQLLEAATGIIDGVVVNTEE